MKLRLRNPDRLCPLALGLVLLGATGAQAQIDFFIVTNTNDSGAGSLRSAIGDAVNDADPDPDRIIFSIPGGGVRTISPESPLPALLGTDILIDGLTQPGADCSTWPPTLLVQIEGSQAGPADGLAIAGNDHAVRGLVINRFSSAQIQLSGAGVNGGHQIQCNFIGTDHTGSFSAVASADFGIFIDGAVDVTIGGPEVTDSNVVSGISGMGIAINGDDNDIEGNYIGTDATGTYALPNDDGVRISVGSGNTIGGPDFVGGNVISGNDAGIVLVGAGTIGNLVIGNWIGLGTDLEALPNGTGVLLSGGTTDNAVGLAADGFGNFIHGNDGHGVLLFTAATVGNSIRGNSMAANGALGIRLSGGVAPTPNDAGDADVGPNQLQNHPEMSLALLDDDADQLFVHYEVPSDPANALFPVAVDFYIADVDAEEGVLWIGSHATDGGPEMATLAFELDAALLAAVGNQIVATATDGNGNTSEFSAPQLVPEPGLGALAAVSVLSVGALGRARAGRRMRSRQE